MDYDLTTLGDDVKWREYMNSDISHEEYSKFVNRNEKILRKFSYLMADLLKCHFVLGSMEALQSGIVVKTHANKLRYSISFTEENISLDIRDKNDKRVSKKKIKYDNADKIWLIIAHDNIKNCKHCVIR